MLGNLEPITRLGMTKVLADGGIDVVSVTAVLRR